MPVIRELALAPMEIGYVPAMLDETERALWLSRRGFSMTFLIIEFLLDLYILERLRLGQPHSQSLSVLLNCKNTFYLNIYWHYRSVPVLDIFS